MHVPEEKTERTPGGADRPQRVPSDTLREQQAIAAAMFFGDEMRRDGRAQTNTITLRLAGVVGIMSLIGLVILFGFARIAGDSFNPFPYMIVLGIVAAGSAVAAYWGFTESRRDEK
jgi:hypothetical protein